MLNQITPLILTYNEAPNLERTLHQLTWAEKIVVVDSFSDDATTKIASSYPQVHIAQRVFDTLRDQWNFGLTETGIETQWVLALDADYLLTDELITELKSLEPESTINGYEAEFIYCLNGERLRSGIYPPVVVLYRRTAAEYEQDGHAHRVKVEGRIGKLQAKILHDDRKPLRRWLDSQTKYAELEARKLSGISADQLSFSDRLRRLQFIAPAAVLFYCLIVRGGVFDGWAGFYYAFQRMLAELMLSLYLLEARISQFYQRKLVDDSGPGHNALQNSQTLCAENDPKPKELR